MTPSSFHRATEQELEHFHASTTTYPHVALKKLPMPCVELGGSVPLPVDQSIHPQSDSSVAHKGIVVSAKRVIQMDHFRLRDPQEAW